MGTATLWDRRGHISPFVLAFVAMFVLATLYLLTTPHYYLAPLPALAIPVLLLLGGKPDLGLYLILVLVPFSEYVAFMEQLKFLTISKAVGAFVLLVVAVDLLSGKRRLVQVRTGLWVWIGLFVLICLISALYADYPERAFNSIRRMFNGIVLFFLVLMFFERLDFQRRLVSVISLSVSVSALLAIMGYLFNIQLFAMNLEMNSLKRAVGAANDPNFFAAMLVFTTPLLIYRFFHAGSGRKRLLALSLVLLSVGAIALTHSRSGILVLGIVLLFSFMHYIKRLTPRYVGLVALILTLGLAAAMVSIPESVVQRMASLSGDEQDSSIGRRVSYLYVGWDAFLQHPWLGVGLDGFREVYAQSDYAREFEKEGKTNKRAAHNTYVEVAVGTGIAGLIGFGLLIYMTLRDFHRARQTLLRQHREKLADLVHAYRLSFWALLFFFLFLSSLYLEYFWLGLAISQVGLRVAQREERELTDVWDIHQESASGITG